MINGCTESTGSGGACYISGNGHTVTSSRLTMTQNAGRSLYVDGNSCHIEINHLLSTDFCTGAGSFPLAQVYGTSQVIVNGGYVANTTTIGGVWDVFV